MRSRKHRKISWILFQGRKSLVLFCIFLALLPLIWSRIVMEYCGGGSVSDICQIIESGINEDQIALVCREALKVSN